MGSHLAPKAPGAALSVEVSWTASTKNSAGSPITWPYFLDFEIIERATGIVRQSGGSGLTLNVPNGARVSAFTQVLSISPLGDYDYKISLSAQGSDSIGNPGSGFVPLGSVTHPSAIKAVA
jgi:hypothetical protein